MVAALVRLVSEANTSMIAVSGLRVLRHMLWRDPDAMFDVYVAQRRVHMLAIGVLLAHHSSSQELALAASLLSNSPQRHETAQANRSRRTLSSRASNGSLGAAGPTAGRASSPS